MIESICYIMRWEIGQYEIAPNDWIKKMPRKEKYWNEKDAQMGKDCVEKDEKWFTYY